MNMMSSVSRTSSQFSAGEEEEDGDDQSLFVDLDGESTKSGGREMYSENKDLKQETMKTSVVRCLVITTLLTSAAIVANIALIMALNEEEVRFKEQYNILSQRLLERFFENVSQKISVADSMASQISFGNTARPYLTSLPNFDVQSESIRELGTAMTISYAPFLSGLEERREFEAFASFVFDEESRSDFQSEYIPHEGKYDFDNKPLVEYIDTSRSVQDGIFRIVDNEAVDDSTFLYAPIWQVAPFNDETQNTILFNQMSEQKRSQALFYLQNTSSFVISDIFAGATTNSVQKKYNAPVLELYYPILRDITSDSTQSVGVTTFEIGLEAFFEKILTGFEEEPITAVVQTSCGAEVSFLIRGDEARYIGVGDLHENIPDVGTMDYIASDYEQFDSVAKSFAGIYPTSNNVFCSYRVSTYPTIAFHEYHLTNRPLIIELIVGAIFLFTVIVFLGYDCLVERRQRSLLAAAQRTNALVGSLFPQGVRDRLYMQNANKKEGKIEAAPKARLKTFMANDSKGVGLTRRDRMGDASEPIADLFPNSTVLFADISGFSAWASERQPSEVFTLLETFFTSFDSIARKLKVFKVETVGDCYVAATGVPDARADHATAMVRFANAMMLRANDLAKALESRLGPGTGDLTMRIGIHSGPVTAGVLRGEKSRFQLFGDTMNSASRMESTATVGMIQISSDTANILIDAGKSHWIEPREDLVDVKGKGTMQTFWVRVGSKETTGGQGERLSMDLSEREFAESKERLIDWNLTAMLGVVERIVASRGKTRRNSKTETEISLRPSTWEVKEEVQEVVSLAPFEPQAVLRAENYVEISSVVKSEMRDFIAQISNLYLDNPFHNFAHASHVTMSCHKLFKRINRPDEVDYSKVNKTDVAKDLHKATYGLSSDPLTQLAIIVAALVHDAGHQGVPNNQLAKESPKLVAKYGEQSLAEQHSLDISLELLESPSYANLRACIMPTYAEQERFGQLIINTVLATDIFDKDLSAIRKARWAKAFGKHPEEACENTLDHIMNRKATIVLEHVIQASDVAHTMQHWKIYQKWNQNLYEEMYQAFENGRSEKDPTPGWYKGELWFFDNYIIPLAKKLKECGVFGISSEEYLHYATENRNEWEQKGENIVLKMEKKMKDGPRPIIGEGAGDSDDLSFNPDSGSWRSDFTHSTRY